MTLKASFRDASSISIKYMDTYTDIIVDLESDEGTVIIPDNPYMVLLTSSHGTATINSVPSPNKVKFHLEREDYESLGVGESTLELLVEGNSYVLGVDIMPSLVYNKVVDESDKLETGNKPIIPASTGDKAKIDKRVSDLFDDSGYDI